jgi:hypothetical protein
MVKSLAGLNHTVWSDDFRMNLFGKLWIEKLLIFSYLTFMMRTVDEAADGMLKRVLLFNRNSSSLVHR